MRKTDTEYSSRDRPSFDASDVEAADARWGWLYRIGGAAALFGVALVPIQLAVFVVWGQPDTARGWFELFGESGLGGLLAFEILFVVNAVVGVATVLALYVALRKLGESLMAIALALGLLEAVAFIVARPAIEMLYLSNQYAEAATDAQRAVFLAAGEMVLATFHGTAFHVGINLFSLYYLIVPLVMLRGEAFGKVTACAGIAAAVLNWGLYVPGEVGLLLFTLSVLPLTVWNVLISRRLFRLVPNQKEEL